MPERHDEGEADGTPPVPTRISPEQPAGVTNGGRTPSGPEPSAQLLRLAVAQAPMSLMALDRDGVITLLEGRGLAVWAATPGELVGRSIFALALDQPEVAASARRALAGETLTATLERRGIVLETRWTPLRDDAGAVAGALAVATDITERARAEQALREREARQAVILKAIPDLIFRIDRAGVYLDVWASQEELLFVPREAIVGHPIDELLPPEVAHASVRAIVRTLETCTPQIVEYELPLPDGPHYFEARLVTSGPDEVVSMVRDITEHRRAELARAEAEAARARSEEALRQSEERFRMLIEAAPIGVCVMTAQGRFATVNDAYCALTGYAREELLAGEVGDLHPPEERQGHLAQLRARFATGRSEPVEFTLLTKQGERRTALGRGTTVAGRGGRPQRLAFVLDITERKGAEEALRRSEQRFRALIEHSFDGVLLAGPDGRLHYASPSIERFLGYPLGASQAVPFAVLHPADAGPMRAVLRDLLGRPGATARAACRLRRRDGAYRWIEVVASNRLDDPAIAALVLNLRDVTEQRQALVAAEELAAERQRQAEAAEGLARLRSDFVATASHELRTPLTAVMGYSELLVARWDGMGDAVRREYAARIAASAGRQQQLVEDLLLAGQIEAGHLDVRPAPAPVAALVRQAAGEVVASYGDQRIDAEGPEDLAVAADPARAVQVLVNLLDNAAKYSPEGSPVAVAWGAEGDAAVVRVRDRGPGLPAEGREQLFTRFGRLPGSRMRAGRMGTGLGLYLGRELARAMGGELDLEATGPEGSTFRLRLPLAPPAAGPPATS